MYRAKRTSSNKSALSMRVAAALSMPCSSNHRSFDVSRRVTIEGARPRRPEANEITRTKFPFVSLSIHGVSGSGIRGIRGISFRRRGGSRSTKFQVFRDAPKFTIELLFYSFIPLNLSRSFYSFFPCFCQYIAKFLSRRVTNYEEKNYARYLK